MNENYIPEPDFQEGCCSLCRGYLDFGFIDALFIDIPEENIFDDLTKGKNVLEPKDYVCGRTSDLDKLYSMTPCWTTVCRAIVQVGEKNSRKFHLCGVGLTTYTDEFILRLPRDDNKFFFGPHWECPEELIEAYIDPLDEILEYEVPRTYMIHERCWQLMTRVLDVELIKEHLDLFVKALREFFYLLQATSHPNLEHLAWLYQAFKNPDEILALSDPWRIPEVRDMLLEAEKSFGREKIREISGEKIEAHSIPGRELSIRPPKINNSQTVRIMLPPELVTMIMDFLPTCGEIRLLILAFPQWRSIVPHSYWRRRFVNDILLPIDEVPGLDALDWEKLYLQTDDVFQKSHGLQNQRRIMKATEIVKEIFLNSLDDEHSPSKQYFPKLLEL
ncbi:hypothetical protein BGW36DRAFT_429122 [Talaromyces proteolyticus]|uniref:F-box domain-containing protein n=1 Tax=Talaromyces proteolyticus TaxID=1131652 RepID=A0AAD4KR80_9EURO|nr:uncharacterized protein BGW36DRAFT_429122 [Talaromyces proteolyticus]KAH8695241.1 hypothetical protein BGW36DRAFT_429122 [Talaromyces proteolyticus]